MEDGGRRAKARGHMPGKTPPVIAVFKAGLRGLRPKDGSSPSKLEKGRGRFSPEGDTALLTSGW